LEQLWAAEVALLTKKDKVTRHCHRHCYSAEDSQHLANAVTEMQDLNSVHQVVKSLKERKIALQMLEEAITSQAAACEAHVKGISYLHFSISDLLSSSISSRDDEVLCLGRSLSGGHEEAVVTRSAGIWSRRRGADVVNSWNPEELFSQRAGQGAAAGHASQQSLLSQLLASTVLPYSTRCLRVPAAAHQVGDRDVNNSSFLQKQHGRKNQHPHYQGFNTLAEVQEAEVGYVQVTLCLPSHIKDLFMIS
jgi:hypothetical protein